MSTINSTPRRGTGPVRGDGIRHRLALALGLALSPGLASAQASTWLVTFEEPPLATYDGTPAVRGADGKALATPTRRAGKLVADDAVAQRYLAHLDQRHAAFLDALRGDAKQAATVRFRYRHALNGLAVELDAAGAAVARALPGVVAVEPDFVRRTTTDAGPAWVGAETFWNTASPGSAGRGEGAIVGIIDSGIRPTHPSFAATSEDGYTHVNPRPGFLGLCNGSSNRCNGKLIGIYDFTSENARDGVDANGHGSHVASTAAGNFYTAPPSAATANQPLRVSGVAPRAHIVSYKACTNDPADPSSSGICTGSALVAALDRAIADGVDVVNYSIGSVDDRDPWQGVRSGAADDARSMLNARAAGVVVVVSAGNEGPTSGSVTAPGNAPWVITAAASTHDRRFGTVLSGVQGTGIAEPLSFSGAAQGGALERRRVVHAKDYGNALCGTGASQGATPTGASNPFAAGTFNGEIVVCVRGTYARVEKSFNVRQAGAAGYVLANTLADAESIVSDNHGMPAVHLGYAAGQQLQQRLEAARLAGGQVTAAILGTQRLLDAGIADQLAAFSSRGPAVPYGGWLKPDAAAPGVSILAADADTDGLAFLQGTSMAAPHIAGAAALLAAARPAWTPSQIESALLTTARSAGMRKEDAVSAASALDRGSGRIRVDDALRAGLYFDLSRDDFIAGDPLAGGSAAARAMNRPSLVDENCELRCGFTRRVTGLAGGGSWRVEARLPDGARATVDPTAFTLGAGQSQALRIDFDVDDPRVAGGWVDGEIAFVSTSGGIEQRIPVALFANPGPVPTRFETTATATSGAAEFDVAGLVALPEAGFRATPLVRVQTAAATLGSRGSLDTYANPGTASIVRTITVGGVDGARVGYVLGAETASTTSRDVNLYIGQDFDGDLLPDENEELCAATGTSATERCGIELLLEGALDRRTFWIYAINQRTGGAAGDVVNLGYSAIPVSGPESIAGGTRLVATGPSRIGARAGFRVRIGWDQPAMLPGETWAGFVDLGAIPERPGRIGRVPVLLRASSALAQSPRLLDARNDAVTVRLLPGVAHERIAVDVPAGATELVATLSSAGAGTVDLFVARAAAAGSGPEPAAAPPRSAASGSATGAATSKQVVVSGAALAAGRWYLTPVNTGGAEAEVVVGVTTRFAGPAASLRDNAYFNPARSGHGVLVSRAGDQLAATWFTYRADGSPTWYLAQAVAPGASDAVWRAPLRRSTWNGTRNQLAVVGEVLLTRTGANAFQWTWQVDGQWGSEPFVEAGLPGCVENGTRDYTGVWFAPATPGYGFVVFTTPQTETQAVFLYDAAGNPAWLYGQVAPFGSNTFGLLQFSGFCPQCAASAPSTRAAGTLVRGFADPRTGSTRIDAGFLAPLSGAWNTNDATQRISVDLACPRS
jgi:subtilisin family serine protease